jgi:large subunit ribosomal protein L23
MNLANVILGPVVTEKAERLKAAGPRHTHTIRVAPEATKIDVKNALKRFYDVDVEQVRIMHVVEKTKPFGAGKVMRKRHEMKKALVTLSAKSKPLDLASFQTQHS